MNGLKIMCMKMEHLVLLDSVSFLPCALRKLPEALGLTTSKAWHHYYFNNVENLNYVGPIPDISYYGANEMREEDRKEFLVWYESQRSEPFDNRDMLETYCQDGVTGLRQACRVFTREFMRIGHIDVFVESITIASSCKVLRKRFLQPETIGLIQAGGYTCNNMQEDHDVADAMEHTDCVKMKHGRNGREYRLPELST